LLLLPQAQVLDHAADNRCEFAQALEQFPALVGRLPAVTMLAVIVPKFHAGNRLILPCCLCDFFLVATRLHQNRYQVSMLPGKCVFFFIFSNCKSKDFYPPSRFWGID